MSFVVTNLSNELAKNNAVYFSAKSTPNPSLTIKVRILGKVFKACFIGDL
jgi:hypothetical protein